MACRMYIRITVHDLFDRHSFAASAVRGKEIRHFALINKSHFSRRRFCRRSFFIVFLRRIALLESINHDKADIRQVFIVGALSIGSASGRCGMCRVEQLVPLYASSVIFHFIPCTK